MAVKYFNDRQTADLGTADTTYTASTWDVETRTIYLMGRRPEKYVETYADPESDGNFAYEALKTKYSITEATQGAMAQAAATELSERIVTDELINRTTKKIEQAIAQSPDKNFDKIRIIYPFPIDQNETTNEFAPALAAKVREALADQDLDLPVEFDLNNQDPILNIVNNDRGSTSDAIEGQEGLTYSERLIRQAVYTGTVDQNAIYVPVDDFLVAQSTMAAMMSYIQSNGGTTVNPIAGVQLFTGINIIAPQQATLDYLNTVCPDHEDKEKLQKLFAKVGMNIDFNTLEQNTVSNVEMMFIAGVLADSQNPDHETAFNKMLEAIGSNPEEAEGNSPSAIFHAAPMSIEALEAHCETVMEARKPLISENNPRFPENTVQFG